MRRAGALTGLAVCAALVAGAAAASAQVAPPAARPQLAAEPTAPAAAQTAAAPVGIPDRPVLSSSPASARAPTAGEVIKAILGLVVILVLAYLAGHPRVQEIEELLGISQVITAGFPFVLLGAVAHHPTIGILPDPVLAQIRPLLPIGLGWIGFSIGSRFDARRLDELPRGTGWVLLATSLLPFAAIVGACGLILVMTDGLGQATFLRDAVLLGIAGIIGVRGVGPAASASGAPDRIASLVQLQESCAVVGLILVAAFFRPPDLAVGWQVPAVAWVLVTLGMGTALAAITYAVLSGFRTSAEVTVLMLGSICLTAGLASYLRLSPIAVCFIAGALLFNLPATWKEQVRVALIRLERPIYLVFLVVAGTLWRIGAWQGWVLLLLFVPARLAGKLLGVAVIRHRRADALSDEEHERIAIAPMGALAIGIIVNAQDLYTGATLSWMVSTVIGGAIASEVVVQLILRRLDRPEAAAGAT